MWFGTRVWTVGIAGLIALAMPGPTGAQTGTVLAVADFADMGTDGGKMIRAERLSGYLQQRLQALAGDRLQFVMDKEIRAAMVARGLTPADLLTPSRAKIVAASVGASQIVTGRWRLLSLSSHPDEPGAVTPKGNERMATAILEVWMFDSATGKTVFEGAYTGRAWSGPTRLILLEAAREALDQAAIAIARM